MLLIYDDGCNKTIIKRWLTTAFKRNIVVYDADNKDSGQITTRLIVMTKTVLWKNNPQWPHIKTHLHIYFDEQPRMNILDYNQNSGVINLGTDSTINGCTVDICRNLDFTEFYIKELCGILPRDVCKIALMVDKNNVNSSKGFLLFAY